MNKREWMLQAAIAIPQWDTHAATDHAARLGALYDAICATTPETPQEGAWVEHDGDVSKAPEEGRMVEWCYRDGSTGVTPAANIAWDHTGDDEDVVRWRYA